MQRQARPEAFLIKPAEGSSYAEALKDLKRKVTPGTLGFKTRCVRETKNGETLIEVGPAADRRTKLSSAIRGAVGAGNFVRELVPRTEVEVLDHDTTLDVEEVTEAVRKHFGDIDPGNIKVNITKRAFRVHLKVYVELSEELASRPLRTGYLKVSWMWCRVRKKTEVLRCYCCQGFGHMATNCKGPDRTK